MLNMDDAFAKTHVLLQGWMDVDESHGVYDFKTGREGHSEKPDN